MRRRPATVCLPPCWWDFSPLDRDNRTYCYGRSLVTASGRREPASGVAKPITSPMNLLCRCSVPWSGPALPVFIRAGGVAMRSVKVLLAVGCLSGTMLSVTAEEVRADHRHRDKVSRNYYQHHQASPHLVRSPYPGRYRDYALRYHYQKTRVFHAGPYYHVYHGKYLGHLNRPYHLGFGPPRSEWKRQGARPFPY